MSTAVLIRLTPSALDDSYTSKIDGTTYTIVKAWNGTEETEYKYEGTLSGGIKKGRVFEYSSKGMAPWTLIS